ncbi:MAG: winged helix-turn-helix transcriptional regulator [Candidatus Helarchaeota archaeon]
MNNYQTTYLSNYEDLIPLNQRKLNITIHENYTEIESILQNQENPDRILYKISTKEEGLEFELRYQNNLGIYNDDEYKFEITFEKIIEYIDMNLDGIYNKSEDHLIQEKALDAFHSFLYFNYTYGMFGNLHCITITSADNIFVCQIYAIENFIELNNTIVAPTRIKFSISIINFPFINNSSDLAIKLILKSQSEYESEPETEDEQEGFALNESGVLTAVNNFKGIFSWKNTAFIDGNETKVKASPIEVNRTSSMGQFFYLNYPRGSIIFHDPKIGVEGILRVPIVSDLPISVIIVLIIILIATGVVISKQEYREYLLKRVLHLNTEPHRLNMEEVLENENRSKIINLILEEPGIHFNELLRRTGISAGTLAWHLDILETYKVVQKRRIGQYLVYFSYLDTNPFSGMDPKIMKSRTTLDILNLISDNPGMYQNQIAKRLDLNHKTIKYHLDKLLDAKLIYAERKGRRRRFYPVMMEIKVKGESDLI